MTQEERELILKNLSARLPYKVRIQDDIKRFGAGILISIAYEANWLTLDYDNNSPRAAYIDFCKPYLRPLSSMTEEEYIEYLNIDNRSYSCPIDYAHIPASDRIDWLNTHHFDYRGLILKGLALEAPKGMYNLK